MQTYHHEQTLPSDSFRTSSAPVPAAALDALSEALLAERKLIDDLTEIVLRQREAIANSDSFVRAVVGAPNDAAQQGYGTATPAAYSRSDAFAFSRTA